MCGGGPAGGRGVGALPSARSSRMGAAVVVDGVEAVGWTSPPPDLAARTAWRWWPRWCGGSGGFTGDIGRDDAGRGTNDQVILLCSRVFLMFMSHHLWNQLSAWSIGSVHSSRPFFFSVQKHQRCRILQISAPPVCPVGKSGTNSPFCRSGK